MAAFLFVFAVIVTAVVATNGLKPVYADGPDQLARGSEMFHIRCEPCHGDKGQGLALWRLTWAPADQNCQSLKCHGRAHPPDGFYMPLDAPPIIGPNTLARFGTARDLYAFISAAMPFDKPGELSSDDYWAVTSFLLNANGKLPPATLLSPWTAEAIPIAAVSSFVPSPHSPANVNPALVAVLGASALLVFLAARFGGELGG